LKGHTLNYALQLLDMAIIAYGVLGFGASGRGSQRKRKVKITTIQIKKGDEQ